MSDPIQTTWMTEEELLRGSGVVFTPANELVELLDKLALEVATIRELLELVIARLEIDP